MRKGGGLVANHQHTKLKGQAGIEYMLLLVLIFGIYTGVVKILKASDIPGKIVKTFEDSYQPIYQYGHPKAVGPDDLTKPGAFNQFHPRLFIQGKNRFFINPQ